MGLNSVGDIDSLFACATMSHANHKERKQGSSSAKHRRTNTRPAVSKDTTRTRHSDGAKASNSNSTGKSAQTQVALNWRDIDGWFTDADAEAYEIIVERIPANGVIVEVGAWMGRSTGALIEQCRKQGKAPHILVVDTFQGSPNEQAHLDVAQANGGSVWSLFNKNMRALGRYKHLMTLPMTSSDAADLWSEQVDAVFIDATHTFASVCNDITMWRPKLKHGGILAGHDADWAGVWNAVTHMIREGTVRVYGRCWLTHIGHT